MRPFTYSDVGATKNAVPPPGYHYSSIDEKIGHGRRAFDDAAHALMSWAVQRGAGIDVAADAEQVSEGVELTNGIGVGRLRIVAPCRVVWTVYDENRVGFAYGTLQGHPERGEESLVVTLDANDDVWFSIRIFSAAASWYAKLGGPITTLAQTWATRRYVSAARRLANRR